MTKSKAITTIYALFGAPHNAHINLTKLNQVLDELMAQRTWVELSDTQIENVYYEMTKLHRGAPMPWGQIQFGKALQEKFIEVNT
jgi:hypothetical protein